MQYPIIDSHQHFWKYDPNRDKWMTDAMQVLHKDYLPVDLKAVFAQNHISGSVLVQADPTEKENQFLLELAAGNDFIKGVIGWIDLESEELEEKLDYYRGFPRLKGFRELLQDETKRDRMLDPGFLRGIGMLNKFGFSFDLLIRPDQLAFADKLATLFPEQRFIIDHLAKPHISQWIISEWKLAIKKFAPYQNVFCKISGMVTEANWEYWKEYDFRPYIDTVVETFGTKRIMFGSDWPVCLLAGNYEDVKTIAEDYFQSFSDTEQSDFFGGNAKRFYQLA